MLAISYLDVSSVLWLGLQHSKFSYIQFVCNSVNCVFGVLSGKCCPIKDHKDLYRNFPEISVYS